MADSMEVDTDGPRGVKRTAAEAGLPPETPRRIKALDLDVVNKIAAGEIIVAPMHALKELLENSVDAGSTIVEVVVKEGGLKLLQITDNGHGIEKDDLPILCERFTTSKLQNFEDLMSIGTYGFRGEALASISHIAHLKVTTRTANSSCAWQAFYADGKLAPPKPGQSADPKPTAGRAGTQITVEDLFYNIPNRRRAFRSPSEEYAKVLDVITRYAVHREGVAFSIKKYGESGTGFSVAAAATKIDRIKQAYGGAVAKELMEFKVGDDKWGFKASGYATNANYSVKRTTLLVFINNRSVESSAVKKAIEQTYQMFLPKGGHPFVYLCLEIDPGRVDVNVHPTKREVHFLNEDEIVELVCDSIRESLAKVDTSRTFKTQTLLPGVTPMTPLNPRVSATESTSPMDDSGPRRPSTTTKKPYENNLIRTDSRMRKITSMLPPAMSTSTSQADGSTATGGGVRYSTTDREQIQIRLSSVKNLRAEVRDAMHDGLTEVFASLTYVGVVDVTRRIAAIQAGVKLYLVDYGMAANEFFYQVGLTDFGNFGLIQLQPAPPLRGLLEIAAEYQIETFPDCAHLDKEQVVQKVYDQLMSRRSMIAEYFAMEISDEGNLETIPLLLKGYVPCMAKLPTFLLRLGPFVDWTREEPCFKTFLRELASFYVPEQLPRVDSNDNDNRATASTGAAATDDTVTGTEPGGGDPGPGPVEDEDQNDSNVMTENRRKELEHALEHVLFPAFRSRIVATPGLLGGVMEVANLKGLYRVFERC